MIRHSVSVIWVASAVALGCGGAAVPQQQLTAAQASIKGAEVGGAAEDPKASLHLKLAREQIEKANALIADGENEEAARVIERGNSDAELAIVLAKEARAKKEAADARDQIEELKQRIQK